MASISPSCEGVVAVTQLPESWDPCKVPEVWVWLYQVGTGAFSREVACQDSKRPSSSLPYGWLFLGEGLGWAQSNVPPIHRGICAPSKSQDSQDMDDNGNEFICNSCKGLSRTARDCPCAVLDHERAWPQVHQGAWAATISVRSGFTHTFTP